ncbi:transposase [Paenibacillus sonchi]|uniref:transposase n=1 Tax=Paenibacillus sonchi TaxID=373687 RepID=UPI001E2B2661|nr:transposase [Paenibacillus sonchi]
MNLEMVRLCLPSQLILDLDSTVETVYGNHSKAAKGVNAFKPGRKSHHPLLAFEGQSRLCLNAVLRAENVHSSTEAAPFLKDTFDTIRSAPCPLRPFGKGLASKTSIRSRKNGRSATSAKSSGRSAGLRSSCLFILETYDKEDWIIEVIDLWYQATSWKKPRRVAVIRKARVVQVDQACLLLDTDWEYETVVTSLVWESIDLWRFYNQRYCMENYIKEDKRGVAIDKQACI